MLLAKYKLRALALLWIAFSLQQGTRQMFGATLSSIQGSLGASAAAVGKNLPSSTAALASLAASCLVGAGIIAVARHRSFSRHPANSTNPA